MFPSESFGMHYVSYSAVRESLENPDLVSQLAGRQSPFATVVSQ